MARYVVIDRSLGKPYKTTVSSLALASALAFGLPAGVARAQVTIPSSTTTVSLQALDPAATTFEAPATTTIVTSSGHGVNGDATRNWILTNRGTITGASTGVLLSSTTPNGATFDNFGAVSGLSASFGQAGVRLDNGGALTNHIGASIRGAGDGIFARGGTVSITNHGLITNDGTGTAVYFEAGGTLTQSADGSITGAHGVLSNGGSFTGTNAGNIATSSNAAWIRGGSTGTFTNQVGGSLQTTGADSAFLVSGGAVVALNNSGTISGSAAAGTSGVSVDTNVASRLTLNNTGGTITGVTGVTIAGSSSTIANGGVISGTGGTAVSLTGANNTLTLDTGSTLNGAATSTGAGNLLLLQGTGSEDSAMSGFASLTKLGAGAWTLSGAVGTTGTVGNTIDIQAGTLTVAGAIATGAGGGTTIASGANLVIGSGGTTGSVTGPVVNNGTLTFFRSDNSYNITTTISGSGVILFRGTGITAQSSYSGDAAAPAFNGPVIVESGARLVLTGSRATPGNGIAVKANGSLSLSIGSAFATPISIEGIGWREGAGQLGALRLANATASGPVTLTGDARITVYAGGELGTISGVISDAGAGYAIEKTGGGRLVLSADNSYSGGTTISAGTLQIGDGGTSGSIAGDIVNNAALWFDRSDTYTVSNTISGTGGVFFFGGGTATLTGNNSYNSGTSILEGSTLIVSSNLNLGATNTRISISGDSKLVLTSSFELSRPVSVAGAGTTNIIDTQGNTNTISGAIISTGGLGKDGTGTLILTGANSYSGGTVINAGTLQIGAGASTGSIVGNVTNNSTLAFNRSDAMTFGGVISGSGAVTQAGTGTTTLTATNSYTGGTNIENGVLSVANDGNLGTAAGPLTFNGGTLRVTANITSARAATLNIGGGTIDTQGSNTIALFSGLFSGDGGLTKTGPGSLILTADNNYTGVTTINGGALQLGNGGTTGSLAGAVVTNNTLRFNRSGSYTVGNTISGTGGVFFQGGGSATMTGNNSHGGDTRVFDGGTLIVGANANLGAANGRVVLSSGSKLVLTSSFELPRPIALSGGGIIDTQGNTNTISGGIIGGGALGKDGTGTLILTGAGSYNGGAVINAGTLQFGNGGTTGSITGNVTNNGTLTFNRADAVAFDGVISGSGGVVQAGAGTTTLTASSSYTGTTNVNAGRLVVNGALAGAGPVTVASDATLGGIGSIAGAATVGDGGHLAPGSDVVGTLTLGSLALSAGSQLDFDLGLPGIVGGTASDLVMVSGSLTLDGTLNITDAGGFSRGVYRLINYGGALTNNGLELGGMPPSFSATDMLISTFTPGEVNLVVSAGGFGLQFWDGPNVTGNGAVDGGAGTWTNATSNWTAIDGAVNAPWQGGFAVFQGTPGTVTLGEAISFEGLQFRTTGYVIEGGGFGLTAAPDTIIRVDPELLGGATLVGTINAQIAGTTAITKTGTGTLILGGINSYTGGTVINEGAVEVSADANLGAAGGGLTLNSGTLITTASFGSARGVTLGTDGGSFSVDTGTELTLSGAISGAGRLSKAGAGTLILSGTNDYAGGTTFGAGVLAVSSDASLGTATGGLDFAGGTLRLDASFDPAATRAVTLGDLGGTIDTNGNSATLTHAIAGAGALTKAGAGTLTLTGASSYAGGTTISAGTLQIGNGGTTGSITGDVVNDGVLAFNRSDSMTFDATISGTGALSQAGTGTTILTGANSYAGGTTISAGTLQIGDGGTTGSITGTVVNNGALVFNRADAVTFGGGINGTGTLSQIGAGTLTLSGVNLHTGGTIVSDATLVVSLDLSLGAANGPLTLDGGTLLTTAGINSHRSVILGAGGGTIDNGGFFDLFAGPITGPGGLTVTGTSAVTLAGDNSYAGGTTIAEGTLQIGNSGTTGSIIGNVANSGTLAFRRSDTLIFDGVVSGTGALTQVGSGTTILTGDSSYAGGTTISAGTLQIGNGGTTGSIAGDVVNNGVLAFNRSDEISFDGGISGTGALTQTGTGTLTLTGSSIYSGPTTVTAGRLNVDGALGNTAVTVASGATLSGGGTIAGPVTIADGGHLAPGPMNAPGALSVGALAFAAGAQLDWRLGEPNVVGGPLNDIALVAGDLTLDGTLNIAPSGGFMTLPGSYQLIQYGGALTDNGLALGSLPDGFSATQVQTVIPGQINLIAIADGLSAQFWDGADADGNGLVDGGSGTWTNAVTNWTAPSGAINQQWLSGMAIFASAGGDVALGEDVSAVALQFTADGYRILGGGQTLTLQGHPSGVGGIVRVDSGVTAEIGARIAGTPGLTKTDPGTLVLSGDNSYSGGTTIRAGTLQIGNGGTTGSILGGVANNGSLVFNRSDAVIFDGAISGTGALAQAGTGTLTLIGAATHGGGTTISAGTLQIGDGGTAGSITGDVVNNGALVFNRSDAVAFGGVVSGTGTLSQIGTGTLTLSGLNTYSGGTSVSAGTLAVSTDANLGAASGGLTIDDGTLLTTAAFTTARATTLAAGGATIDNGGNAAQFSGVISGPGSLATQGAGSMTLVADNSYTGGTTINSGTLQIGNGGTTGSILGDVVDNGTLAFNRSNDVVFGGVIRGSGSLTQAGSGTLTLTGASSYTGGSLVSAGTLRIGDGAASGSIVGSVINNGVLVFDRADSIMFGGAISGTGSLTQAGSGTLILTGPASHTGGTTIAAGTLQVGNGGTTGSLEGNVVDNGLLVFNRSDNVAFAGAISGTGAVEHIGSGTLILTGTSSYSGGTTARGGTLQIAQDVNIGAPAGALLLDSGTLRWAAAFDLAATRSVTLGAGGGSFDTNGFAGTIGQGIGGAGGLTKLGAGRLTLAGNSDFAGPTSIMAGVLAVNGSIRSATTVGPNGALSGVGTIFGNVINRGLIAPGSQIGTLTVAGNYSGDGGRLEIETVLGADDSPSDRFVITGGAATGSTAVNVVNLGGGGALTQGDGILVVDAADGGTTAPTAFTLANPVLAGPYEYLLFRGGATGTSPDDWFLRSALNADIPSFRVETSLYAALPALGLTYGRTLIGSLHERVGDIGGAHAKPEDKGGIWSRILGRDGVREVGNGIAGQAPRFEYDFYAMQLGVDLIRNSTDRGDNFAGVYGAYGSGSADVRHYTLAMAGEDKFDAYSLGAYWTHFTPTGWYLDGVVQGSWYDMRAKSIRLPELKTDGFGFAASIEGGRALQTAGLTIEPQAQLIYQNMSLDSAADIAAQIRFDDMESLAGRVGSRVAKTWTPNTQNTVTLWGRANLWYEFLGNTSSEFSSAAGFVPIRADLGGTWAEFGGGITAEVTRKLTVHLNFGYETGFDKPQHSYDLQGGIKLRW